jgi:hypothetical protein
VLSAGAPLRCDPVAIPDGAGSWEYAKGSVMIETGIKRCRTSLLTKLGSSGYSMPCDGSAMWETESRFVNCDTPDERGGNG